MKKLLLISNSVSHGKGYLDHVEGDLKKFLGKTKTIVFIPYALKDYGKYTSVVRERFSRMGYEVVSVHKVKNPRELVKKAEAIFIGGGNTFKLLKMLYRKKLAQVIRKAVENGTLYVGSSAGSNVACPTIKTTNDMPIVYPPTLNALNLIPFQINPHYFDVDKKSTHMGETREQRLKEFHEENTIPVVGLKEGAWLIVEGSKVRLEGKKGAKVFERDKAPKEYKPKSILNLS